ncbi:MAG: hypothetical protein OD811_01850 [Alphaproteobacteria bacterium]
MTVATIIISSTLGIYEQAQIALRTNQTIVAVGLMSVAVRTLHANVARYGTGAVVRTVGTVDYGDDLLPVLVLGNLIPPGMQITFTGGTFNVNTPFGGPLEVAVRATGLGQGFFIEVGDLADDVCINIATQSVGGGYYGLSQVELNGTIFLRGKGKVEPGVYPITPQDAQVACNRGGAGNTLRWTYT